MSHSCTDECFEGEVRLSEGQTEWDGRLEVCWRQRWSTVSSDGWTNENSQVVCNALGYDFTGTILSCDECVVLVPSLNIEHCPYR